MWTIASGIVLGVVLLILGFVALLLLLAFKEYLSEHQNARGVLAATLVGAIIFIALKATYFLLR